MTAKKKAKPERSVVDESIRRYKDAEREEAERDKQTKDRIALAIRFKHNSWLFAGDHLKLLTTEEKLKHQLEDRNFIASRTTFYNRTKKKLTEMFFKKKVSIKEDTIDKEKYLAEKRIRRERIVKEMDLIKHATEILSIPKIPAHHEDVLYMPDYYDGVTVEQLEFAEQYLLENLPLLNPPLEDRKEEELAPLEETIAKVKAQNGDDYCPGRYHNYLGKSRLYPLRIAPATTSSLFRFSEEPVYPEDALLPDKKKAAAVADKARRLKELILQPYYRFKRAAFDISRKRVAEQTAIKDRKHNHHNQREGFKDEFCDLEDESQLGPTTPDYGALIANENSHPVQAKAGMRKEDRYVHYCGPPETPDLVGYGHSRKFLKHDIHKESMSAIPSDVAHLGGSVIFGSSLNENSAVQCEPSWATSNVSIDIRQEYKANHKPFYDRAEITKDIKEKFIDKKKSKHRLADYYPHRNDESEDIVTAFGKDGKRLIKSFNFHTKGYMEVGDRELFEPQQSLSSSREHFADGATLNGTDEFIQHFPSHTTHSSSVLSHNQSRVYGQQYGVFTNDNDTHIASRSSKLSIGSLESRYHVKCRLLKQRTLRGLDKYHIKGGLSLVSSSNRKIQRKAREDHRSEVADKKDKAEFMKLAMAPNNNRS